MISKKKKWLFGALIIIGLLLYKHLYSAPQIFGVVRDASTGKPIANAVVVATWYSQRPGYHSPNREFFEAEETVTNAHGEYLIRGWPVKLLPRFFASIAANEPQIMAYKFGYLPKKNHNFIRAWRTHGVFINWPGNTDIKIQPLEGNMTERIEKFNTQESDLPIFYSCRWVKTKKLLLEVDKQFEERELYYSNLRKEKYKPWFIEQEHFLLPDCESPNSLLIKYRALRNKEIKNENN